MVADLRRVRSSPTVHPLFSRKHTQFPLNSGNAYFAESVNLRPFSGLFCDAPIFWSRYYTWLLNSLVVDFEVNEGAGLKAGGDFEVNEGAPPV